MLPALRCARARLAAQMLVRPHVGTFVPLMLQRRALHCAAPRRNQSAGVSPSSDSAPAASSNSSSSDAATGATPSAPETSSAPSVPSLAERLKRVADTDKAGRRSIGGIRSRVPTSGDAAPTPEQVRALAEEEARRERKREERRARMELDENGQRKRKPQELETWPDHLVQAKCDEVLRQGRAALAALVEAGQFKPEEHPLFESAAESAAAASAASAAVSATAAAAASPATASASSVSSSAPSTVRPLSEFVFPSLNSFERWKVHVIAGTAAGAHRELAHEAEELPGAPGKKLIALRYQVPQTEEGRAAAVQKAKDQQQAQGQAAAAATPAAEAASAQPPAAEQPAS